MGQRQADRRPCSGTVLTVAEHNGKTVTISYGGKTAQTVVLTVGKAAEAPFHHRRTQPHLRRKATLRCKPLAAPAQEQSPGR